MFVFTASVLPSRVNRWNHQPSDLHDPLAGGRAVLRLPVHRDCLLQRRRVLKLPETGIHHIMIRRYDGGDGSFLMAVVVTKLQGFYLCTSTLARDCCVIALDYKLGKAKKSLKRVRRTPHNISLFMMVSYLIVAPPLPMIAPTMSEATRSLKGKSTDLPRPPRGRGPCEW